MFHRPRIYTVHEKASVAEPSERIELVREGFSIWAFLFNILWLLAHRLWVPTLCYLFLIIAVMEFARAFAGGEASILVLQVGLQFLLGIFAHDIQRWQLDRRGYTMTGVVCAESELMAELHAYDLSRTAAV